MKNIRLSVAWVIAGVSLAALMVVCVAGQPFAAKAQEQKRIQYRIVDVLHDTQTMKTTLNEFGSAGWDLAAVSAGDLTTPRMIFKK